QKMSKSKGNVLDPIDLIDGIDLETLVKKRTSGMMQPQLAQKIDKATRKQFPDGIAAHGTDALRYTFYSLASTGRDINFDMGRIEGYRNFCNKIWNAARYVFMNVEEQTVTRPTNPDHYSMADRWIQSRFQQALQLVDANMKLFRLDLVSQAIYDFFWNDYCDWYLELSKPVLWAESESFDTKNATRYTLLSVLEQSLRLAHPLIPFITEEIWQKAAPLLGITGETIMLQPWPRQETDALQQQLAAPPVQTIEWIKGIVLALRNIRGELNISPARQIAVLLNQGKPEDRLFLDANRAYLLKLAKLESIRWLEPGEAPPAAALGLSGDMEILVPLAGLIDIAAEQGRLNKEIDRLQAEIARLDGQLGNESFCARAPEAVVGKVREQRSDAHHALNQLQEQLARLGKP
ncbi:MAG TPA: class I tRNA ligase family protein, partial [Hyphomicrobiales bacterium]|nr:class I tRNA ligase family protein [Hyphomicrobiales bacterium]